MASITKTLSMHSTSAAEVALGENDAVLELQNVIKFEVLDDVFKSFIESSNLTTAPLVRRFALDAPSVPSKILYDHNSITYRATYFKASYGYYSNQQTVLDIKLANNGFVYEPKVSGFVLEEKHHNRHGWVVVSKKYFDQFPTLRWFMDALRLEHMEILYHFDDQRVDVKMLPNDASSMQVLVTYERGYPESRDARGMPRYW